VPVLCIVQTNVINVTPRRLLPVARFRRASAPCLISSIPLPERIIALIEKLSEERKMSQDKTGSSS
jgi:hypothetical protein